MDYFKLTEVFRDLALQAGDAIMEIYLHGNIAIETKIDASPVTNADKTADAIIYEKRILFWLILSTAQKNLLIKRENSRLI